MTRSQKYVVYTNPMAGRDDEYNAWYSDVHLADMCRVPGIAGAQRYELVSIGGDDQPPPSHRYLAIFDFEAGADPATVIAELMALAGGPDMTLSDAMDSSSFDASVWRERD